MSTILGVRICGDTVADASVLLDQEFMPLPTARALGVPLMYKRLPHDRETELTSRIVVQFVLSADNLECDATWLPGVPLPPPKMWALGTPGVLLARADQLPFSRADWAMLNDYIHEWGSTVMERGLDAGADLLRPDAFMESMKMRATNASYNSKSSKAVGEVSYNTAFLPLRFPIGTRVRLCGLEKKELNGAECQIERYSRDRVGVKHSSGTLALKPERIILLDRSNDVPDVAPKRLSETRAEREARQSRNRANQLADSFFHSIRSTSIPWEGEAELFGMGPETRANKHAILNAWCALIQYEFVTKDAMIIALWRDEVRQLFEGACKTLVQDHAFLEAHPLDANLADAESIVDAGFTGIIWDSLE